MYKFRPLGKLIEQWQEGATQPEVKKAAPPPRPENSARRHALCTAAQALALFPIFFILAAQIYLPYFAHYYVLQESESQWAAAGTALGFLIVLPPLLILLSASLKWLVIGKYQEGRYPLWGSYYFRWWLVNTVQRLTLAQYLNGTPFFALYLRMMGMQVAKDAQISTLQVGAEDLVSIGSNVSLGSNVLLNNVVVEQGWLVLSHIQIGDHVNIGNNAVLAGDTEIGAAGELGDLGFLPRGTRIPPREIWGGSPAVKTGINAEPPVPPAPLPPMRHFLHMATYQLLFLAFPLLMLLPLLPTIFALNKFDEAAGAYDFSYFFASPLLALAYIGIYLTVIICVTRLVGGRLGEGVFPVTSSTYMRKWFTDQLQNMSLFLIRPIYATVFMPSVLRALGVKVGRHTEVSTASNITYSLLELGAGGFIADGVTLGEADVRNQRLILQRTRIGNRSFVGNSASIPQGSDIPDNHLIGSLSLPPDAAQLRSHAERDWMGVPAIPLPNRQQSSPFSESLTMFPGFWRFCARGGIETARVLLPMALLICFSTLLIAFGDDHIRTRGLDSFLLWLPIYYLVLVALPQYALVVAVKWLLAGTYKPGQHPMWTLPVWLSEAVTSFYETSAVSYLLDPLRGTALLPFFLRFLGAKIGKRVFLDSTDMTEFDLVTIGDEAELNQDCGGQTHLFEDRIMKMGALLVQPRATIGGRTILLYSSEVGAGATVGPQSLLMKGETLPPGTRWQGNPVQPDA